MEPSHELNIDLLEAGYRNVSLGTECNRKRKDLRVASRLDEVKTGVNTVVNHFLAVDTVLLFQVSVVSGLDVFEDGLPALVVVDKVTKSGCVDDS
jgi:hypothetical protein